MTDLVMTFSDGKVIRVPLDAATEVTIGRDPASTVRLDSDLVSRQHAVIRIVNPGTEQRTLSLTDLDSTNGTWVRGRLWDQAKRILPSSDLAVEDEVEFGKGGPRATIDLDPRGWHDLPRTDEFAAGGRPTAAATRLADAPGGGGRGGWGSGGMTTASPADGPKASASFSSEPAAAGGGGPVILPPKVGIGQQTLERALARERQAAGRKWLAGGAVALIALVAVGGALFWFNSRTGEALKTQVASVADETEKLSTVTKNLGAQTASLEARVDDMPPGKISEQFGDAVVFIASSWKLYDKGTGKQIWHKFITQGNNHYPAYVELPDGQIVRWLITEDENITNQPIGAVSRGSGFVVEDDGLILTNRHVAAAWLMPYDPVYEDRAQPYNPEKLAALYQYGASSSTPLGRSSSEKKIRARLLPMDELKASNAWTEWVPGREGYVFHNREAYGLYGVEQRYGADRVKQTEFETRDRNSISFPRDPVPVEAALLRASPENDVALIKLSSPTGGQLKVANLAPRRTDPKSGETVTVMGYPAAALDQVTLVGSRELLGGVPSFADVRTPTVSPGYVGKLIKPEPGGLPFDIYQLTVNTTGKGNSGGPVFDSKGQVVGIFTWTLGGGMISGAVPIEYGHKLMELATVTQR